MRDANRPYNRHHHCSLNYIAGEVGSPWVVGVDVEVGDASIALAKRGAELGEERVAIPTGRQRRLGGRVGGHDTQTKGCGLLHLYKTM